jgi:hypothetical protein
MHHCTAMAMAVAEAASSPSRSRTPPLAGNLKDQLVDEIMQCACVVWWGRGPFCSTVNIPSSKEINCASDKPLYLAATAPGWLFPGPDVKAALLDDYARPLRGKEGSREGGK